MIAGTFSHYRILSRLGAGGMGEVYLADDSRLGRKVAIKFLAPELIADERARKRQQREARAAASLEHPNICSIYEIGDADGRSFIVMQYVEGETLADRIRRQPLELREALDLAVQIADALDHAHAHGLVHRDIKPQNVMIAARGGAKVLAFGLAKSQAESEAQTVTSLTLAGALVGTMRYMSPEQVRGQEPDARSDIFSFGSLLYEMICGRAPFAAGSSGETAAAILTREPEPVARYAAGVPHELNRIVRKCLAKDREQRYQGMREVRTDLESFRRDIVAERSAAGRADGVAAPAGVGGTRRLAKPLAFGAVALLVVAGAALFYVRPFGGAPPTASEISSLAVMPLKSLDRGAGDHYLGLGIANAIITKVSQVGGLAVRPTSAMRKYVDQDVDALEAARQLRVDSVLDGSFQRSGDRLRVTVNLLNAADGSSLWSDDFDVRSTDIFAIQDEISQQVAARVRAQMTPVERARLAKRQTSNTAAYDYYMRSVYLFSDRQWASQPREPSDQAIELVKKAIDLDPSYAQAHAQLGYGYAWTAINFEHNVGLIERAKQEIDFAERLDPQLADTHVARAFILWSQYERWQVQPAIRELRLAQHLDPNAGHFELSDIYGHIGLDEQHERELALALALNPTSDIIKQSWINMAYRRALPEDGAAAERKFFDRPRGANYFIEKGMSDSAEPLLAEALRNNPDDPQLRANRALLLARQGKHRDALAAVPSILETAQQAHRGYHHVAHTIARVYALTADSAGAVKWLRIAADEGQPNDTLYHRDTFLDPIRQQPVFTQFMSDLKARWEAYQREFGS